MTGSAERSGRGRQSAGFTLIELVVVVMIVAIASLVVYPSVKAGANQRAVRLTLQQLVSMVRRASSMAVLRRETVEVWLWPARDQYALVIRDRPADLDYDDEDEQAGGPRRLHSRGLVLYDDDGEADVAPGRKVLGRILLPKSVSFGEVEGGRFVAEELIGGSYNQQDAVLFEFYPTGGSSGGKIELQFDISRSVQSYKLVINPLISRISMEE